MITRTLIVSATAAFLINPVGAIALSFSDPLVIDTTVEIVGQGDIAYDAGIQTLVADGVIEILAGTTGFDSVIEPGTDILELGVSVTSDGDLVVPGPPGLTFFDTSAGAFSNVSNRPLEIEFIVISPFAAGEPLERFLFDPANQSTSGIQILFETAESSLLAPQLGDHFILTIFDFEGAVLTAAPSDLNRPGSFKNPASFLINPVSVAQVPLPASALLLLSGLFGLGLLRRRKAIAA